MNWNITIDGRDAGTFYGNHKEARTYVALALLNADTVSLWSENGDFICDFNEDEDEDNEEGFGCFCDPLEGHDCTYATGGSGYL